MTNKEIERYRNSYKVVNGIGFCRVNNDINGNPRYVVHFLAFITDEEMRNDNLSQNQLYAIAKKRANDLGTFYKTIDNKFVLNNSFGIGCWDSEEKALKDIFNNPKYTFDRFF